MPILDLVITINPEFYQGLHETNTNIKLRIWSILLQLYNSDSSVLESRKVNQLFSERQHFIFSCQKNSENPETYKYVGDKSSDEFENWLAGHICHKVIFP